MMKRHEVGFALSGGSTKGALSAGIQLALWERGVRPTYLVGTSVGAIHAAWETYYEPPELVEMYRALRSSRDVFKWDLFGLHRGLKSLDPIFDLIWQEVDGMNPRQIEAVACYVDFEFSDHQICYASNKEWKWDEFQKAVRASATVPVMMQRKKGYPHWYDGGVKQWIPVSEAIRNCEKVFAIATGPILDASKPVTYKFPEALGLMWTTIDKAMQQEIKRNDFRYQCMQGDVTVIAPTMELPYGTFELNPTMIKELIDYGYDLGMEAPI